MVDNAAELAGKPVLYYPYLEAVDGAGKGLLAALANRAAVVVGDDFPCFFLPRMVTAAANQIACRFELIDSNGLLPMRAATKLFARAIDFRIFLQKHLLPHLGEFPEADPLADVDLPRLTTLPTAITKRWPAANLQRFKRQTDELAEFPIDHSVPPVATAGGCRAAQATLRLFLDSKLSHYGSERNEPEVEATSGLSPYLHFGHISVHAIFDALMRRADWTPDKTSGKSNGSSQGWWGVEPNAESFLDELITWRELGYNMCSLRSDYDQYDSLPAWAKQTLAEHADDPRPWVYSLEQLQRSQTHDRLWNAAQRQLAREGRMHNYLRMLWGKKILEWSPSPRAALDSMIELNNKYALDGRNPNSYSGIFWVLGRYDRAWGPERPIFGKIRYMSSDNTARKFSVKRYLENYSS
jgi:deoxyribodipyrimidine photo-lyase